MKSLALIGMEVLLTLVLIGAGAAFGLWLGIGSSQQSAIDHGHAYRDATGFHWRDDHGN